MNATKESLILEGLLVGARQLAGEDLLQHIFGLVHAQFNSDLKGTEKKAAVMQALHEIGDDLAPVVESIANALLSMVVDIVVAYAQSKLGDAK